MLTIMWGTVGIIAWMTGWGVIQAIKIYWEEKANEM